MITTSTTANPTRNSSEATPAINSKRKRSSEDSCPAELVTFLVGRDKEPFTVHKEFACRYSPVLRVAFTGPFLEEQTNTYRLDYVNPSVVRLLVQWLYTQKIDLHIEIDSVLERAENVD
ncbi:hypothetical protein BGZ57DRAFT_861727 [Hyaloscypha finlandica]|nr:hypothetical protein BGZ57DRAFT_861727 [Hyaloscypha finlandica]